ncbi:hypothetical protein GpartN1_g1962.t1 [Galdieria partita]|uniref:Uncharacterized protein n=1 Tax=Galdieria partita TaxID=83374 RepID=A0A9C7PUJ2_9RHOD|nr:hypothetical protein GpartN1_g1962.t1 [Galdieria partita]
MSEAFSLPQETTYRKPAVIESSQDKTTSSSVQSETSLPDKLKPIPVESVILYQKQQKKKNFVQKLFSCFYTEKETEQVKKPVKRETPKPIQQVILPATGQPPKGTAPWERSGKKPRKSPNNSENLTSSNHPTTTENESTRSGNSSKSGGSSAPWQSGLRKKNKRIDAKETCSSFSIPDELLKQTKFSNSDKEIETLKETSKQPGQVPNSNLGQEATFSIPKNMKQPDKSLPSATKLAADTNNEASGSNNVIHSSPPPPPPPSGRTTGNSDVPKPPPPPVPTKVRTTTLPSPPPPPPPSKGAKPSETSNAATQPYETLPQGVVATSTVTIPTPPPLSKADTKAAAPAFSSTPPPPPPPPPPPSSSRRN